MEMSDAISVLRQVQEKHPGMLLEQEGKQFAIPELITAVERDIQSGVAEASFLDEPEFFWGYDADGKVSVVRYTPETGVMRLFAEAGAGGSYRQPGVVADFG